MKKFLIPAILVAGLFGGAGLAIASEDEAQLNVPADKWLTVTQITEKFMAQLCRSPGQGREGGLRGLCRRQGWQACRGSGPSRHR
jgi:hypothetical protein